MYGFFFISGKFHACTIKISFLLYFAIIGWTINVKKYIRMGITIFQFVIWGGISSDIRSEIMFYDSADASP